MQTKEQKTGEPWERNYDVCFKFTPYHVSPISIALNFYIPVSICNWEGPLHCQNWASTCPLHFHPLSHCQAVKQFGRKGKHPCGIFSILIRNSGLLDYLRQLLFLNCFPIWRFLFFFLRRWLCTILFCPWALPFLFPRLLLNHLCFLLSHLR